VNVRRRYSAVVAVLSGIVATILPASAAPNLPAHLQVPKSAIISAPHPRYPDEAGDKRLSGIGTAVLLVDVETGVVRDAVIARSTGHAILDNAAVSAFRRWRFKPGAAPPKVRVPISFSVPTRIHPRRWYPFEGVVRAVNTRARSITIKGPTGTDAILLTDMTHLTRNGERIPFTGIAVGDTVRGNARVRPPSFQAVARTLEITRPAAR
jgi:TonB family protein